MLYVAAGSRRPFCCWLQFPSKRCRRHPLASPITCATIKGYQVRKGMEHHAEVLTGGSWYRRVPDWRDLCAVILVLALLLLVASGAHEMITPFAVERQPEISLAPTALPYYALRTTMRMLAALVASLVFTFTYATLAAKSRRAEMVLIPLLDVLQSVPILGYLSFTVVFFVSLFPGNELGPELAAIFAVFTSQAWNMALAFISRCGPYRAISTRRAAASDFPAGSASGGSKYRLRSRVCCGTP